MMPGEEDLSLPKWLWAVFGVAALVLFVSIVFIVKAADRPVVVDVPLPSTPQVKSLDPTTDRLPDPPARPHVSPSVAIETKPKRPQPATGAVPPDRSLTLGLSTHTVMRNIDTWVINDSTSETAFGDPHRTIIIKPAARRGFAMLSMIGQDDNLIDVALSTPLFSDDSVESVRWAMCAFLFLDNVVPEYASRYEWYRSSVKHVTADVMETPVLIVGNKRLSLIAIPTDEGSMLNLCLSHKNAR